MLDLDVLVMVVVVVEKLQVFKVYPVWLVCKIIRYISTNQYLVFHTSPTNENMRRGIV